MSELAWDKNPRLFVLDVTDIDITLTPASKKDTIHIRFFGKVLPSTKERFREALTSGDFKFVDGRLG